MARRQLWGGNFSAPPSEVLKRLNDSFSFDRALLDEDVEGSIAWAAALRRAGVLSLAEARKIIGGLEKIRETAIERPEYF